MNMKSNTLVALALGLGVPLAALPQARAQSAPAVTAAPAFTQLGAHVHGRVSVNLALEGGTLSAELDSPALNVVGFERAPRDAAERATVAGIDRWLGSGVGILGVPAAAGCTRTKVDYTAPKHGEDHDHEHEHDAAHAEESEGHSDYEARYTYSCTNPAALAWVDLWLARRLRNVAEIDVNLVTPQGQSQLTVAGDTPRIALK